jgi:exopolysaccharide biosynthesis WecB/TagA/CpsF family protein
MKLFNLDFNSVSLYGAVRQIISAAQQKQKGLVVTPNVDHVVMLLDDYEMRCIYKAALFRYADGMPIVWLSRLVSNNSLPERVTGADLLPHVCKAAAGNDLNLYFLGGNPGIVEKAADNMRRLYPGVSIVGAYCPPFGFEHDPEESQRIIDDINSRNVHILFIGVGTPKQEKWAAAHLDRLQVGPILCIGAALDFAAGTSKRAPVWVQRSGMEWFWRLASDPRRLWRRYLLRDSRFIPLAWRELTTSRHDKPTLSILGTRGIPARHGGFETFAEQLSLYLVSKGWTVTVYCQDNGGEKLYENDWNGVRLIHIPVHGSDAMGSIFFDWKSTLHVLHEKSLVLTLGYNTALFCFMYRLAGVTNLINMDGFEWKRKKWSFFQRAWLYLNERFACLVANHLIADHPVINTYLGTRVKPSKITMIPYGADSVAGVDADLLKPFALDPGGYVLVVARAEPENSILEIVEAFSSRKRGYKLVLVGGYDPKNYQYHAKIVAATGDEIVFLGPVYEKDVVMALRTFCRLYIHGHQVGGTNPSLLEAMAAGSPVLARDNQFNRWVSGDTAKYFKDGDECCRELDTLLDNSALLATLGRAANERCKMEFSKETVMSKYEKLLSKWWYKSE